MRSMQLVLALAAGLLAAGAPGNSSAAWNAEENGPRFGGGEERATTFKPESVSLAPKDSVAELRKFQELDSHNAALYGPTGPGKPALDRLWAGRGKTGSEGSSIAVDTD